MTSETVTLACNVGGADKTFRILLGLSLLPVGLLSDLRSGRKALALGVSAIALTTALTGYCPLNALLGLDTCHANRT